MKNFCITGLALWLSCAFLSSGYAQQKHTKLSNDLPSYAKLWDLEQLSVSPKVGEVRRDMGIHSFTYSSLPHQGRSTEVFAYYSNPDILLGKKSKQKFPGVVLVHGGGGKAYKEWVKKWAAEGYAAIAIDLSGLDGEGNRLAFSGPDQADVNKFDLIEKGPLQDVWTHHAVGSIILAHSWLLNQKEVDKASTFITGVSWGGYLTCIAMSLDSRFRAAAPVYGCGYYAETELFKPMLDRLSPSYQQLWINNFDPSVYMHLVKMPVLFVNGNTDLAYPVVPYHKTYSLLPENSRFINIIPDMIHSHPEGWLPHEIRSFFDHYAFGTAQVSKLELANTEQGKVSVVYRSDVPLLSARFYYSKDKQSPNATRVWEVADVQYDHNTHKITCALTKDDFAYGFFYVKDHRNISCSSAFIIP